MSHDNGLGFFYEWIGHYNGWLKIKFGSIDIHRYLWVNCMFLIWLCRGRTIVYIVLKSVKD